jgi:hypothetical protein
MRTKRSLLISLLLAGSVAAAEDKPNTLTKDEEAAGWRLLFNGMNFDGWRGYRMQGPPKAGWEVKDGLLKTVPKAPGRELITVRKYIDFEFTWEWKIAPGGNNGIKYFVTEERPAAPGHEYQMVDDKENEDGSVSNRVTASFYDVLPPSNARPNAAGEWNQSRVIVKDNHVEHWLNGQKVLEYEAGSDRLKQALLRSKFAGIRDFGSKIPGHIMLTYHHDECWFRNLKIREL